MLPLSNRWELLYQRRDIVERELWLFAGALRKQTGDGILKAKIHPHLAQYVKVAMLGGN